MLEFEKKVMLTKKQYDCLRRYACKNAFSIIQTNYYFDTDTCTMNQSGITCRIRYKNGLYKATVKNHSTQKVDCSFETNLSEKTEFDSNAFSFLGLSLQGELVTERIVLHKDNTCEMVLDRNMYLGTTDYELEIEYNEGCGDTAKRLLHRMDEILRAHMIMDSDISRALHSKSKSDRFFERKVRQATMLQTKQENGL